MASNKGNAIYQKKPFPLKEIASTKGQLFPLKNCFHWKERKQLALKQTALIKGNGFH